MSLWIGIELTIIFVHVGFALFQKAEQILFTQVGKYGIGDLSELAFDYLVFLLAYEYDLERLRLRSWTIFLISFGNGASFCMLALIKKSEKDWEAEVLRHSWQAQLLECRIALRFLPATLHSHRNIDMRQY